MIKEDKSLKVLDVKDTANILKLLGDKTRLSMVSMLAEQECCVCEFVEIFQMSQPSISQHLRKMKDLGIVKEQRKGQWVVYSLNTTSEYYLLVRELLKHVPSQREKFDWLEEKGLRITCY
ncbi:ArsR/SmtB family transcription factor [Niallia taxi]|uniref:ArsR family transcriptional regulator n=1 Tax=Niallia taxi TaxID=2499688 RepID=A0A437K711_9BACI|nr:metalloregulator ArsR/SmtB family transcription factor [Niallia taxi]MDK8643022.1 metalloregulator ArsR/SmtB family transcription factor [Niallia taxi]MED4038226.1 metalloregulator ArsR/SmtB family transcription factor [Niallia taxi]MED4055119.1 metalloregulator ArsR/SmtB family transcription factor [Niallia taxi]MED4120691.1 metalloregulator ArsR/SmtB family transcription factor [Niallia taxi]RVT59389.1 ArsR family transcriptional regulator [Niallia taxi]